MTQFKKQLQQIDVLKKKVNFLEKKILTTKLNTFDFIVEDFIIETLIYASKTDAVFFDKKLARKGIYLNFLHFYFIHYSHLKIDLAPKSIRIKFDICLNKLFSYNLKINVVKQSSPFRDISYKYLKFKNDLYFTNGSMMLQTIVDIFITENLQTSISLKMLHFDLVLRTDDGIYPRFLHFYFLNYSFVDINLNPFTILECFNKVLVKKISYNIQVDTVENKKTGYDILYRYLQFKKVHTF